MKTASAIKRKNPVAQSPISSFLSQPPSNGKKETVFRLKAPAAHSVRLVADFTDWDKSPVEMSRAEDDFWQVEVTLPPGRYAYRFLVNGQWCDDPQCAEAETNSFGTTNAVIKVA